MGVAKPGATNAMLLSQGQRLPKSEVTQRKAWQEKVTERSLFTFLDHLTLCLRIELPINFFSYLNKLISMFA